MDERWRLLVIGAFDHHINASILTIYISNKLIFMRIPFVRKKYIKRYANAMYTFIHLKSDTTSLYFQFIGDNTIYRNHFV